MNKITIYRIKNDKKIIKVLSSKNKSGSKLLNRYLSIVNKLNIVIPEGMYII